MLHAVFPFLAAFPCILHQGNTLLRLPSCSCDIVKHWYVNQSVRPGNTLARGLLSSLEQIVFGQTHHSSLDLH